MALSSKSSAYLDGTAVMNCAETTAADADSEVKNLLAQCYEESKQLLQENRALLDDIALFLLQKETITGDELMAYVNADKRQLPPSDEDASEAPEAPAEEL
jgi:cell division protease FtsH